MGSDGSSLGLPTLIPFLKNDAGDNYQSGVLTVASNVADLSMGQDDRQPLACGAFYLYESLGPILGGKKIERL